MITHGRISTVLRQSISTALRQPLSSPQSVVSTRARGTFQLLLGILLLVLMVAPARAAVTEEGAPNMMVRPFDGPKGKVLNDRVVKVLEEQGADLVPAGFEGPTAMDTDADYAAVAARLNIQAFIQGTATNDNSGWTLKLTVRQGSDGKQVGGGEFKASWFPGLLTKIDEELIPTLEKALKGAQPTAEPPPEPTPEDKVTPTEEEKPRPKPLELDAGGGFTFRSFTANNPVNLPGVLQTRDQSGGMAIVRIGAALYPAALFTNEFLANIGLVGDFERSIGGKTQAADSPGTTLPPGGDLDTALTSYDVGLRVRVPIAEHELGFSALYGAQQFEINDGGTESDPTNPDGTKAKLVPNVDYQYLRLGADFTYQIKSYFLTGDLGLRVVNNAGKDPGEIQNDRWFPRSDVGGVDFGLTAGYAVSERFTITLGMDFRNYFYTMNSKLEDFAVSDPNTPTPNATLRRPVAGGANDMYFAGVISARYSLR